MLKKLLSETALYGLSSMVGRSLNFLLVTLYTHKIYGFERAEYAVMAIFYAYVAFLNVIFTYGMETAYFRYVNKSTKPLEVYNLILSYLIITTIVFSGGMFVASDGIAAWLGYPTKGAFVKWIAIILAIDTLLALPYTRLRFEKKAKFFVITKVGNVLITIALNLFFLVVCKELADNTLIAWWYEPALGVGYVFLANLIANALNFIWLYKSFIDFRFRFVWREFAPLLWYAYPLAIMGLAGIASQMLDRILLKYYLPAGFYAGHASSAEAVGIYAACIKLTIFMSLAVQSFKYAAEPFFFSQAQDKQSPKLFAQVMYYFVITCILFWLAISLNLHWIKTLFIGNPVYHEGIGIVPILLLANLLLGVYYNLSFWFKLTDRTYYGLWLSIGGALIILVGNIVFIPIFGYMACAWVTLVSYASMAWACYVLGQRYYPVPYRTGMMLLHLFLGALIVMASGQLPADWGLWLLFPNAGLFAAYLLFIILTEKDLLKKLTL